MKQKWTFLIVPAMIGYYFFAKRYLHVSENFGIMMMGAIVLAAIFTIGSYFQKMR